MTSANTEFFPRVPHMRVFRAENGNEVDFEVGYDGIVLITEEALEWLFLEAGWEEV